MMQTEHDNAERASLSDVELECCPMCGAAYPEVTICGIYHPQGSQVKCFRCGLQTQRFDRLDKAVGAWNMRSNS